MQILRVDDKAVESKRSSWREVLATLLQLQVTTKRRIAVPQAGSVSAFFLSPRPSFDFFHSTTRLQRSTLAPYTSSPLLLDLHRKLLVSSSLPAPESASQLARSLSASPLLSAFRTRLDGQQLAVRVPCRARHIMVYYVSCSSPRVVRPLATPLHAAILLKLTAVSVAL